MQCKCHALSHNSIPIYLMQVAAVTLENCEEYDQILKGRGLQNSTPPPRTPSKENTYVNLSSLWLTSNTSSPGSWNPVCK